MCIKLVFGIQFNLKNQSISINKYLFIHDIYPSGCMVFILNSVVLTIYIVIKRVEKLWLIVLVNISWGTNSNWLKLAPIILLCCFRRHCFSTTFQEMTWQKRRTEIDNYKPLKVLCLHLDVNRFSMLILMALKLWYVVWDATENVGRG